MIVHEPERDDFWRVRSAASATAPFKEWQHFVVLAPGLDLVVNFSLSGPPGLARDASPIGRVIVLARGARWSGFVDTARQLVVSTDGCRGQFGDHRVEIVDGGYRVVVDAPAHHVAIDARFHPQAVPVTARRQALAPGVYLDWSLTPRLAVDGHAEIAGERFVLAAAMGYHDHNWGQFAWGDDFTWEWGSVLPTDGGDWAVVYSSLMNRARTSLALEQIFVWRRGINMLAAGGLDISSRMTGRYRGRPKLRIPPPMALLHARTDTDVPLVFEADASNVAGQLTMRFTPESMSQVLVPSERQLRGVVAINECVGPVHLTGNLGGEPISWEGRGVFEFVR